MRTPRWRANRRDFPRLSALVVLTVVVAAWLLWRRPGAFAKRHTPFICWAFGISGLVSTAAWPVAILGSVSLGLTHRPLRICFQISRPEFRRRILGKFRREPARHCSPRAGDHLSGGWHARWPFYGGRVADGVGVGAVVGRSGDAY
jgi:hypothetical protein